MGKKAEMFESLETLIQEATSAVETELKLEDKGWINLSVGTGDIIPAAERVVNLRLSQLYYTKDPLAKQAIRLWTDYTFGSGMTWQTENEKAKTTLESFWDSKANRGVLSARGQRKSSDKLLVDGEIFFAIFLGGDGKAKIRRISPLEIAEIITDKDDIENVLYYRRTWTDRQGSAHETIYRSITNIKAEPGISATGGSVTHNDDALIYHLAYNTTGQRGNPLLLPALDWIRQYRRFLASRIAIMLALARFAWRQKITGGQAAVDAIKAKTHGKEIPAGSTLAENLGVDTQPIKADTGAAQAYQDGRMIKLQIAAAVGIPEQYFGDISIGNLATAKTVELPMMKMFQSYQQIWADAYRDIDEVVLEHNSVPEANWYVDRDFPAIAPADVAQAAKSLVDVLTVMPEFAYSPDVQQIALLILGVNDPKEVLEAMAKESKGDPSIRLAKAIREFRTVLREVSEGRIRCGYPAHGEPPIATSDIQQ